MSFLGATLARCVKMTAGSTNSSASFSLLTTGIKSAQLQFGFLSVRNFASKMGLPRVFFDMTADGQPLGRIVMEVRELMHFSLPSLISIKVLSLIIRAFFCNRNLSEK